MSVTVVPTVTVSVCVLVLDKTTVLRSRNTNKFHSTLVSLPRHFLRDYSKEKTVVQCSIVDETML